MDASSVGHDLAAGRRHFRGPGARRARRRRKLATGFGPGGRPGERTCAVTAHAGLPGGVAGEARGRHGGTALDGAGAGVLDAGVAEFAGEMAGQPERGHRR